MSAIINNPNDRTFVYEDSPFQFDENGVVSDLAMLKNWVFTPNMSDFDIDKIDTAEPIYTKKSDILGTFQFDTVNTVDFYDPGSAASPITYAFWATQIALGKPVKVNFIVVMNAPDSTGNKIARIRFVGRIMSIPQNRNQDTGVHTFTVNGEITEITNITRTAS
jgi:hypothetical protein